MTNAYSKSSFFISIIISAFALQTPLDLLGQQTIQWQKSIGTAYSDYATLLFNDEEGNLIFVGDEVHVDFTGNPRTYMVISKIDVNGAEIWKKYHDVAYETFSQPIDYGFGQHFYTVENGQKMISLVLSIGNRRLLYKVYDETGDYYSYNEIPSTTFTVERNNVQAYASTQCSFVQSCYGPDSLIVQKFNPEPVIGWNPYEWTFQMKQNIRTAPIQGHYDFSNQDIITDTAGNVYLLTQIERWDFQFCTDCNDAFIDAYSEIFKFDTAGHLVKNVKLKTAKAVVSNMRFVYNHDGKLVVRIDDINNAGTDLVTTIYHLNEDLTITKQFNLDRQYNLIRVDEDLNLYTCRMIYDDTDPNIKGVSDILVSKFNKDGAFQWKYYFGGSSFDFPRDLVIAGDGNLAFFANTESNDFDIAENHGGQDMWLVKLGESSTATHEFPNKDLLVYPNPGHDLIQIVSPTGGGTLSLYDLNGKQVKEIGVSKILQPINVSDLLPGCYIVKLSTVDATLVTKFIRE